MKAGLTIPYYHAGRINIEGPDNDNAVVKVIKEHPDGFYERHIMLTLEELGKKSKPGDVLIDIGANVGVISIAMALAFPHSKVYAIEPIKELIKYIETNKAFLDQNYHGLITPVNMAIGRINGKMPFENVENNTGEAHLSNETKDNTYEIETHTLSAFLDEYNIKPEDVSLIKMDIEGFELDVFNGSELFFRNNSHSLIIEFNPLAINGNANYFPIAVYDKLKSIYDRLYYFDISGNKVEIKDYFDIWEGIYKRVRASSIYYVDIFCEKINK